MNNIVKYILIMLVIPAIGYGQRDIDGRRVYGELYYWDKQNVRYFRVTNDSTDITTLLRKMIYTVGEDAVIYFPAGNYLITDSLGFKSGQVIMGDGHESKIYIASSKNYTLRPAANVTFRDIAIYHTKGGVLHDQTNVKYINVYIEKTDTTDFSVIYNGGGTQYLYNCTIKHSPSLPMITHNNTLQDDSGGQSWYYNTNITAIHYAWGCSGLAGGGYGYFFGCYIYIPPASYTTGGGGSVFAAYGGSRVEFNAGRIVSAALVAGPAQSGPVSDADVKITIMNSKIEATSLFYWREDSHAPKDWQFSDTTIFRNCIMICDTTVGDATVAGNYFGFRLNNSNITIDGCDITYKGSGRYVSFMKTESVNDTSYVKIKNTTVRNAAFDLGATGAVKLEVDGLKLINDSTSTINPYRVINTQIALPQSYIRNSTFLSYSATSDYMLYHVEAPKSLDSLTYFENCQFYYPNFTGSHPILFIDKGAVFTDCDFYGKHIYIDSCTVFLTGCKFRSKDTFFILGTTGTFAVLTNNAVTDTTISSNIKVTTPTIWRNSNFYSPSMKFENK